MIEESHFMLKTKVGYSENANAFAAGEETAKTSNFARSHIEADMYFENIFPALNIRFISIRENIDSIIIFQNGEINVKFK